MLIKGNLFEQVFIVKILRELPVTLGFFILFFYFTNMFSHSTAHFSVLFYSPNSGCEMTQYFNQLYLICTPAEDRATCVLLLPRLAVSMPHRMAPSHPGLPRLAVSAAHSACRSPIHPLLAGLQWKYQVIGC